MSTALHFLYRCFDRSRHQIGNSIQLKSPDSVEQLSLRVLKVSLFKSTFLFMTLFESYCLPQEREATRYFKHTGKEKSRTLECFLFSRSRKQQRDTLQVTSVLSDSGALCVCAVLCLSDHMIQNVQRERCSPADLWGSTVQCLIC